MSRYIKMREKRKSNNMVTEEIKPEDIMAEENWEEGWKEEDWEIVKITECPKCGSKLESPYNPKNTDASKRSESRGVNKK